MITDEQLEERIRQVFVSVATTRPAHRTLITRHPARRIGRIVAVGLAMAATAAAAGLVVASVILPSTSSHHRLPDWASQRRGHKSAREWFQRRREGLSFRMWDPIGRQRCGLRPAVGRSTVSRHQCETKWVGDFQGDDRRRDQAL
jgi:hypothetical protein